MDVKVILLSGWVPTIQRENDIILMDLVHKIIPKWAWEGINRCRLFLQAITLTDIVTADGTYIPKNIVEVTTKLRESNLLFPVQKKPYAEDIEQWQYLISSISLNGHLVTPLGRWLRSPDQVFTYLGDKLQTTVYKRTCNGWKIFRKKSQQSRRYVKLRFEVDTVPKDSTPVKVIESSNYLLNLSITKQLNELMPPRLGLYQRRQQTAADNVLGKYDKNEMLLEDLKAKWHQTDCHLVCATDGGLKDGIGTSSYAFFFPQQLTPLIAGKAGEYQPNESASSTRQELLGQLGVEYLLSKLAHQWGRPRNGISIMLITDSQASIEIMQNVGHPLGIKDTLRPEMDVAMELHQERTTNSWVSRQIRKVESHISVEDAPDEFEWECNNYVDQMATIARSEFRLNDLQKQPQFLFLRVKAGCQIKGRIVNNALYKSLKIHIKGRDLQMYLMEKYNWTETIFRSIDWKAHHKALLTFPRRQLGTLEKYIFGWLATKKRRYRERQSPTDTCALCGMTEG